MSILLSIAGFAVILLAVLAILRGYDVRLAMLVAGFALGALAGDITIILRTFLSTLADEQYVLPICSAMGFAYVLRQSGCDRQLVLLLTKPIRKLQFFLIPAAIGVAFFVNSAMISQASTAVAVGTVMIPLLRSAGFSPAVVGATLVLGASIGGELLNPGAPELQSIAKRIGTGEKLNFQAILAPLLAVQLGVATVIFWWMVQREPKAEYEPSPVVERVNYFQAMVPVIPLVVLMLVGPPFYVWKIPEDWLPVQSRCSSA
jgi:C4-dicarboxylate transporter, DcuC family